MVTRPTKTTQNVYNAKTLVPASWGRRLSHLSATLGVPKNALIADGLLLLFQFHGVADGLPEPTPPIRENEENKGEAEP